MIGDKISELRKQTGLSQESLASLLNVSRQAISKYENNQSEPDIATIKRLCDIFNVSYEELLGDDIKIIQNNKSEELKKEKEEDDIRKKNIKNSIIFSSFQMVTTIVVLIIFSTPFINVNSSIGTLAFNFYSILSGKIYGTDFAATLFFTSLIIGFISIIISWLLNMINIVIKSVELTNFKTIYDLSKIIKINDILLIIFFVFPIIVNLSMGSYNFITINGLFAILLTVIPAIIALFVIKTDKEENKTQNRFLADFYNYKKYYFLSYVVICILGIILATKVTITAQIEAHSYAIGVTFLHYTVMNKAPGTFAMYLIAIIIFFLNVVASSILFFIPFKNDKVRDRLNLYLGLANALAGLSLLIGSLLFVSVYNNGLGWAEDVDSFNLNFAPISAFVLGLILVIVYVVIKIVNKCKANK